MNTIVKATLTDLTGQLRPYSEAWESAILTRDEMAIAMTEMQAKLAVLNAIEQPPVFELLRQFAAPELGMVEIISNPSDREKVRVIGMALMAGLIPGRDEFAVYGGGKNPSKLYVKAAGYRKLLGRLPGVRLGDVMVATPVLRQLDGKLEVWEVEGEASAECRGEIIQYSAAGKYAIRIPAKRGRESGDITDNIDGIKAKATRRILQGLYQRVAGIAFLEDDEPQSDEESTVTILPDAKPALPQDAAEWPQQRWARAKEEMTAIGRTLPDDAKAAFRDAYTTITKGTPDALLAAEADILQMVAMLPITDEQRETIRTAIALRRAGVQ